VGAFARAIIRDRPLEYLGLVGGDFVRYFSPGLGSKGTSDAAIELPEEPRTGEPFFQPEIQEVVLPSYRPEVRSPAGLARAYASVSHTPRWLLAALTLIAVALLALAAAGRGPPGLHVREVFVLTGMGVAMLLGASATSEFVLRYLIPVVPLLVAGGVVAANDLFSTREPRQA
jgi:hypothetical protein